MMRSLYSGVAGLRVHQTKMDVIGDNIANVNTTGFKKASVKFQDMLAQTIRGAAAPQGNRGGINAMMVGLGVGLGSIDVISTQGNMQNTGKNTDLAIDGDGFFVVKDGNDTLYTRSGTIDIVKSINSAGKSTSCLALTNNGLKVGGWMADPVTGKITTDPTKVGEIEIPVGASIPAKATATATYTKNLDSNTTTPVNTSIKVYDSLGDAHDIQVTFTKGAGNNWTWAVSSTDPAITSIAITGSNALAFNGDGSYNTGGSNISVVLSNGANTPQTVSVDLSGLTQYSGETTATGATDGYESGSLNSLSIDSNGVVSGGFTNGIRKDLGQIALAVFLNPGGLVRQGGSLYRESNNSGSAQIGTTGNGGRGMISPGSLEMSNVDLAQEFTDMITTQRGFQANSKIITTTDQMLEELVNLKR